MDDTRVPGRAVRLRSVRLYHRQGTGRPPRVAWLLEEVGAPYEVVLLTAADTQSPTHRARQPLGRVPVLEDDVGALFESAGLCLHVGDLHPEAGLLAAPGSHDRALAYQWAFFAMTELEPAIIEAYQTRERDPERARSARERFTAATDAIAAVLDGHEYLVADRFGVGDVIVASVLQIARQIEVPLPDAVNAYLDRLDARPARQRARSKLL